MNIKSPHIYVHEVINVTWKQELMLCVGFRWESQVQPEQNVNVLTAISR